MSCAVFHACRFGAEMQGNSSNSLFIYHAATMFTKWYISFASRGDIFVAERISFACLGIVINSETGGVCRPELDHTQ